MAQDKTPKYLQEIEDILREHCHEDEPSEWVEMTEALLEFTRKVEMPSGDARQFIEQVLTIASEKNQPMVAAYIGFRMGVAYERYQKAKRT